MTKLAPLLALAITATSLAANADDGELTITLADGAAYRGVLVERVPNDHVTIKLPTGDVKRFEWKEIKSDTFGAQLGPVVHLEGKPGAFLERPLGTTSHYERVCDAPCDRRLAPGIYRAKAPGHGTSKPFSLDGAESKTVTAKLASTNQTWGGIVIMALGAAGVGLGVVQITTGRETDNTLGYGVTALGCAMFIGGLIAIGTNRSSITVDGKQVALDRAGKWRVGVDGLKF